MQFVSIPNGMEFYVNHSNPSIKDRGFNSQRDGILLTMDMARREGWLRFQFPTGWNSTAPEGVRECGG